MFHPSLTSQRPRLFIMLALLSFLLLGAALVPVRSSRAISPGERITARHTREAAPADATVLRGQSSLLTLSSAPQAGATLQFNLAGYSVGEADGSAIITVTRIGDTTGTATVNYATSNGTASERSDYTTALGNLRFAAGETSKSFLVLITDDLSVEGTETVNVTLSNPAGGAALGSPSTAVLTIIDNDSTPSLLNPIDSPSFFVRQHYLDFLNREPDVSGLAFWTNQITECQQPGATCNAEIRRINVSAAFFISVEFQETGYLVYRLHQVSFNTSEQLQFTRFLADTQEIGRGVVVGQGNWEQQLEANKQAFAAEFVTRPAFIAQFPASLTPAQFVDALNANTRDPQNPNSGGALTQAQRDGLVNDLTNGTRTRAEVLRAVAENGTFAQRQFNKAFVYMQYVGYLRRNPNDLPDTNFDGYNFWLGKLNQFGGNFVNAEMVKAFIVSGEYRGRFVQAANQPPSVNAGADQSISLPNTANLNGTITDDGLSLLVSWSKVSGPGSVIFGSASSASTTAIFNTQGTYVLRLAASDGQFTRSDDVTVTISPDPVPPPPDPALVAPPLDNTVSTTVFADTGFLYSGPNPIQTGVAPGTINPVRVAILRGKVKDGNNAALPKVKVTILNHPEFGQTLTRADGMFDMAVNGGGLLTIKFERVGLLPAQRQVAAPWQDYVVIHDVVLLPYDDHVTAVDLSANTPVQVASGSTVTDSSGSRRGVLMFKQGTSAVMTLPNGSMQGLSMLHVRATEYTVGLTGPQAMPGDLPGTSGYTYAAEYSLDEAVAANATDVRFNQAVVQYNENFLNFPAGTVIPSGSYDRQRGQWIPSESGRVVKILSVTSGAADLDVNGAGQTATDAEYQALGIDAAERAQLAQLYPVNQSLWRVPVIHFTPWDYNWSFSPPPTARPAPVPRPAPNLPLNVPTICRLCIIEVESQTLGEEVGVTGTPFKLTYRSSRQSGFKAGYTMTIPLSVGSLPGPVKRIELEITIAGRMFTQSFPATTNQNATFTWDGLDAYGRRLQGKQFALVDIGYVYDGDYKRTFNFGYLGNGIPITGDRTRQEITLHKTESVPLGTYDARPQALGGWNLSAHHVYDPVGHILYQGDGQQRSVETVSSIITNFAGTGTAGFSGDGGPATQAQLNGPFHVAVAPDGSVYIVDTQNKRIRKVDPNGIISTAVNLGAITNDLHSRVIVAPDGSLITDGNNYLIKIAPNGQATTLAGARSQPGSSGDGGPAIDARFRNVRPFLAPDGSIYISDTGNQRIRKISPDGIVRTIVGNGTQGFSGDGGPALNAQLYLPSDLVVTADGTLYFLDHYNYRIRKVTPDGIITTFAGTGVEGNTGDGGPAAQADIAFGGFLEFEASFLGSLALGPDDSLYFAQSPVRFGQPARVRRISRDGIITAVAGTDIRGDSGEGGAATQAQLTLVSLSVAPDGTLYFSGGDPFSTGGNRVRRLAPPLPGYVAADFGIPSEDGTQLFQFDANGRHLRTVNTLTGATLYNFTYDVAGRLTEVKDGDNNITVIERNGAGAATAIISPYNQRTTLSLDANGYLKSISDPLTQAYQFAYTGDGLMTSETDPRSNQTQFTYDALGRLTRDDDPAGGFKTLARTDLGFADYSVLFKTALNRSFTTRVQDLSTGDRRRLTTLADGLQTELVEGKNGINTTRTPDGETETKTLGPDPRWQMQAPITSSDTITTLGGLNFAATFARSVTLATPGNPLSLTSQTDTLNVNGVNYTRIYTSANKTFAFTTPTGRQGTETIDSLGRTTQSQFGGLSAAVYTYDTRGRLASAAFGASGETRTASLSYNAGGFLSTVTDPVGRTEAYTYDAAGRITQQTLPDGRVIGYAYDAKGNLTSITPPGRPAHTFTFTEVDLASSYVPPNVGAGSNSTNYTYNLDRDLTRITRPDAQQINLAYDAAGRLSTLTIPGGQYTYGYSATTGNLTGITAPSSNTLAYTFDGSLLTRTTWSGTIAGNVSQTYDNFFRTTSQSVNGANTVNFTYDNDSLLTGAGSLTLTRNAQNGLVTGMTLGNVADTIGYNNFAEPLNYTASFNSTNLYGVQYTRDKLGRITQKNETIGGTTTVYAYSYDQAGRLATVTLNGAGTPFVTYSYDSNSNRLSATYGGPPITATYDAQDRLTQYGVFTYTYTANGELQSRTMAGQTTQYSYDVLGSLKGVTLPGGPQIDYVIDGQNRRIGKQVNGTLTQGFLYGDQLRIVAELDGSNNLVSRFVYGSRRANVPDYMVKNGVTYRLVKDHLGSVRLVVDTTSGAIAQRIDYDEFGVVLTDTNPGFQPFGFAGGLYDKDTGLVRFGQRDYDAQIGRWTAKDPILFDGGDSNLYGYVLADPINVIDPNGTFGAAIMIDSNGRFEPYPFVCKKKQKPSLFSGGFISAGPPDDGATSRIIDGIIQQIQAGDKKK